MKRIYIKNSNQYAIVDDKDYEDLKDIHWYKSNTGYAKWGRYIGDKYHFKLMHAEILGKINGKDIDHINRNRLDNRRCNLRHVSRSENTFNQRGRCRIKNISKRGHLWVFQAVFHGKKTYKRFKKKQAALDYKKECLSSNGFIC